MGHVWSGQAPAWPLVSDQSVRRGSGVKRDFACTFTRHFPPVFVVPRSQSRLRREGRTRTLSGPSPDLSPSGLLHPGYGRTCGLRGGLGRVLRRPRGPGSSRLARRSLADRSVAIRRCSAGVLLALLLYTRTSRPVFWPPIPSLSPRTASGRRRSPCAPKTV